MRFLGNEAEGRNIMPLNFIYDNPRGEPDTLMILYKDIDTGEKFVKNIENPEIVVYVVKEQYRGKSPLENPLNVDGTYSHDFFDIEQVDAITVRYRQRRYAVAKILGIKPDEVDSNRYVAGTDIDIRRWYFVEFLHEYRNDKIKTLNIGYFDIEADTLGYKQSELGANYGKFPITCITYICDSKKQAFVFIMKNDQYGRMNEILANPKKLQQEMNEMFDEKYGKFEYNLLFFDHEIDMIATFWQLVKVLEDDFALAWNAPFDIGNLTYRPIELGYDPRSLICDKRFAKQVIEFEEDRKTFVVHKKNHKIIYALPCILEDQMRIYAGVRSGRSKLPSTSLDNIAKAEEVGAKLTYEGDINQFLRRDFWNYILYNVNDVFQQVAINRKVLDTDDIYSRMLESASLSSEVFSSVARWQQYIKLDVEENRGKVFCNNKNKHIVPTKEIIELGFDSDATDVDDDDEDEEETMEDLQSIIDSIADQQTLIDKVTGKKKKFSGAIVLDTRRTRYTGYKINGRESNYVHENVIDQDITAEYPTSISISNESNDTFIGKVYVDNPDEINLPFYAQYDFLDRQDAADYKMNKAALMMETALQGDYMLAGEISLNLPGIAELEQMLMDDPEFKI